MRAIQFGAKKNQLEMKCLDFSNYISDHLKHF